jgi:hypothetical protein
MFQVTTSCSCKLSALYNLFCATETAVAVYMHTFTSCAAAAAAAVVNVASPVSVTALYVAAHVLMHLAEAQSFQS